MLRRFSSPARAVPTTITLAALAALACFFAWSCAGYQELDDDEICKEVSYSIANRTLTCTGDSELANTRHDQFVARYRCIATDPPGQKDTVDYGETTASDAGVSFSTQLDCAIKVREVDCALVKAYGDDVGRWVKEASPSCLSMFDGLVDAGADQ